MAEQQSGSTDNISLKDRANALLALAAVGTVGVLMVKGLVIGEPARPVPDDEYRAHARAAAEAMLDSSPSGERRFSDQYVSKQAADLPRAIGGSGLWGSFTRGSEQIVLGDGCLSGSTYDTTGTRRWHGRLGKPYYGRWVTEGVNARARELPDGIIEVESTLESDAPHLNFTVNDKGVLVPSAATADIIYAERAV